VGFVVVGRYHPDQHPDVKVYVDTALAHGDLGVVKVSQDRDMGALRLTGEVQSLAQKEKAELVAAQAAPGYTIFNDIWVRSTASGDQANVDFSPDDGTEKPEDNLKRQ